MSHVLSFYMKMFFVSYVKSREADTEIWFYPITSGTFQASKLHVARKLRRRFNHTGHRRGPLAGYRALLPCEGLMGRGGYFPTLTTLAAHTRLNILFFFFFFKGFKSSTSRGSRPPTFQVGALSHGTSIHTRTSVSLEFGNMTDAVRQRCFFFVEIKKTTN